MLYARTNHPDLAEGLLREWEKSIAAEQRWHDKWFARSVRGQVALARNQPDSAIMYIRDAVEHAYAPDYWGDLARAFDLAGKQDSAIVYYERVVANPDMTRLDQDVAWLALSLRRLGELYDERGDAQRALSNYLKFVELWKDADVELQPQVTRVKKRVAQLAAQQG
jgi:tetratricopeptide (TPR) repeat protein